MEHQMITGRNDNVTAEDYYMYGALLVAKRSKDPRCQVGACIVSKEGNVVSTGYNCMPRGLDAEFCWSRQNKHNYVAHAELNAIANSTLKNFDGCRMYVTRHPCTECAKAIIQHGIKEVFYLTEPKEEPYAKEMFEKTKYHLRKFIASTTSSVTLNLNMDHNNNVVPN